jgi:hypothetical protein
MYCLRSLNVQPPQTSCRAAAQVSEWTLGIKNHNFFGFSATSFGPLSPPFLKTLSTLTDHQTNQTTR